jgi:transglutaminase-like putative cysteine protease
MLLGLLLLLATLPGCQKTDTSDEPGSREIWDAFYLQDAKIGYGRTTVRDVERGGRTLVEVDSLNHLAISRFGQHTEQSMTMNTLETPDGQLLGFRTEVSWGPSPSVVTGRVEGGQMVVEVETKGRRETVRIPWSGEIRGFRALEQALEEQPLAPGEKRSLKMLMPLVNQVADVQLVARDYESTKVLGVETKLLRIESRAELPGGQSLNSTLWTDRHGQTIKTRIEALQQESFRTSRAVAVAPGGGPTKFDLGSDLIVKLDHPLPRAHQTRRAVYRVELTGEDPAKVFASGETQSIRPLDAHAAELTVRSLRPGDMPQAADTSGGVAKEYLTANSVLQIDDPRIQQMAQEAKGEAQGASQVALALERYVHGAVTQKNFSQAFSTAAEVAESREGDCTEHAVLLAAIARACGIPARVAIGLVYVESAGGFGYHMWTEMYLDGHWTPLDAIMGQAGIGAAHLKLTDSSLDGATAYSSFLPVAQVVGQLKVSVVAAE